MKIDKDRLKVAADLVVTSVNSLTSQPRSDINPRDVANRTLRLEELRDRLTATSRAYSSGEIDERTAEESVRDIMKEPFIQAIIEVVFAESRPPQG